MSGDARAAAATSPNVSPLTGDRRSANAIRAAAVLMLIFPDQSGQPTMPFVRRSEALPHHRGQIALPGGSRDPADASLMATAQREAWEELGIDPTLYSVIGSLEPVFTQVSNFIVTPFVGVAERRPDFRPDAIEAVEVLEAPYFQLADPHAWRAAVWNLPNGPRPIRGFDVGGHVIWGLTARILQLYFGSPLDALAREHIRDWPARPLTLRR